MTNTGDKGGVCRHSTSAFWDAYDLYILKDGHSPLELNQFMNLFLYMEIGSKPMAFRNMHDHGTRTGTVLMINQKHRNMLIELCMSYSLSAAWQEVFELGRFVIGRPSNLGGGQHTRPLYYHTGDELQMEQLGWLHQCERMQSWNHPFIFNDYTQELFWFVTNERQIQGRRNPIRSLCQVYTPSTGPRYKDYANA